MKFMYDNRYRSYGVWPHDKREVEVSLEELTELTKRLEDEGLYLIIDHVDSDGTVHLVKYDTDY